MKKLISRNKSSDESGRYGLMIAGFFVLVLATGTYGLTSVAKIPFSLSLLESTGPEISIVRSPKGIGTEPVTLTFNIQDDGAGLDEAIVRLVQKDRPKELFRKSYETRVENDTITVQIDPGSLPLKEGEASISISTFDKSLWSNSSTSSLPLRVEFTKPRVSPETPQQNGAQGGVELVFYKITAKAATEHGVEVRGHLFQGYPAASIDPELKEEKDLYFSFFVIPTDFNSKTETLRLIAKDEIGNIAQSPFNYSVRARKFTEASMPIAEAFINSKAEELLTPEERANKSAAQTFKFINEGLRKKNDSQLQDILRSSASTKLWNGEFTRPLAAAPKATFAEKRTYTLNGAAISSSKHMGTDLADVALAKVSAANNGTVLFAEPLGIYGNTVVIDHGLGVATLYGHLSGFSVKAGDEVRKGQEIGRTGMTGLAGGDHLHFEVRVHGAATAPLEWWDVMWMRQHIDEKVASVNSLLTGGASE